MKISMVLVVAMAGGLAFTMPTQKELENAAPVVQERLAKERQSVADGRKTRTEVADAAVIMAASADSEAEKVLLLKGAFTFYVRDGQYGKASETLGALRIAIDRVSDETINSLVKSVEGAVEPEDRPRFHRMMVSGLKSAKVDGVTWYYRETEKGIEIGTGLKNLAAVDERTSGRLVIPNEIHGKPVVSVGAGTLHGCTRVESVFIPKNAKSVMIAAFTGCSNLKTIEIDPDNPTYRSVGGLLADKAGTGIGRCVGQPEISLLHFFGVPVGCAVCYESVYGEYCTGYVKKGAKFLTVITNDAWWGDTPGYRQHLSYSSLRAIELRRDVARCANTGISCFIDQKGRIVKESRWWEKEVLRGTVNLNSEETFFVRHGDFIGRVCTFVFLLLLLSLIVRFIIRK